MALWKSFNIDIPRSLKSSDSLLRRKFKNWMPTSCRLCSILSQSTISFERYAKMAEETDLDKWNFGTSEAQWPWSWPWIRLKSYWCAYVVEVNPHTKLDQNWKKNFFCGRTDVRTDRPEFQSIKYIFMDYQYEDNDGTDNCTYSNNHYAVHITLP